MAYLFLGLFVAYLVLTLHSVYESAKPSRSCKHKHATNCHKPLVNEDDIILMELHLFHPSESTINGSIVQAQFPTWNKVDSCQFNLTIPASVWHYRGLFSSDDDTYCNVTIPNSIRTRGPDKPKPLQARFVFLSSDDGSVLHQVGFELTTVIDKGEGWSKQSSAQKQSRNLLQQPFREGDAVDKATQEVSRFVPHLKYGRAPVRVRFVAEYRDYGSLHRKDGINIIPFNSTTFRPIFYIDDKALQGRSMIELAEPDQGKPPVQLRIKVSALSPVLDSLNVQVIQGMQVVESFLGTSELDEIRYFLSDEKLYRFLWSQVISYIHLSLDFMAFRDEVRFYRGKRSFKGVSTSSVVTRFICSLIIFLYLLDGGGTSWLVLTTVGSSVAVEAWKVQKMLRPKFTTHWPFLECKSWISSTNESDTYDRIAVVNLAMALYPVVLGWAVYSLHEHTYSSWWSWFISNLANAVYTFGFISMCPQLYVNYRLKSVTHLPWKVFIYKMFNTFVDDAFAWLIDMPWKHRLMTLRDDVVFLLLLGQVYLYRVDKKRTNEFGYSYEDDDGDDKEQPEATGKGEEAISTNTTSIASIDETGAVTIATTDTANSRKKNE